MSYHGTANSAEQVKATILQTTCDPQNISAQYDSYYDLMPYAEVLPTAGQTTGKFFAYFPSSASFTEYNPKLSAKGTVNSYHYRSADLPGGSDHVSSKGSIETSLMNSFQAGGVSKNLVHNICSYYIWYLFRTNEVHPDLVAYYQGNVNQPTIKGIADAEMRWAMVQREKFIANVAMKEIRSLVNQMRTNPPNLSQKGQITSWLSQQVSQTSGEDNADWSSALEEIEGLGSSEKEEKTSSTGSKKSILPQVAVASVLATVTFVILNRRGA